MNKRNTTSSWWYARSEELDGLTPFEYLQRRWRRAQDRVIAAELEEKLGRRVTEAQVRLKRYRSGLLKSKQGVPAKTKAAADNDGERTSFKPDGNYAEAQAFGPRIKTLDQLLEICEVDLAAWDVYDYELNKWEVGAKLRHSNLKIDQGIMTGWIREDGMVVEPLYQVKAKLVRNKPIAVEPVLQAVVCEPLAYEPAMLELGATARALVFTDAQFGYVSEDGRGLQPFHDERVLAAVLALAELCQPDRVDFLGDLLDLPLWSNKFIRSPEFYRCTQPAIMAAHAFFRTLREIVGPQVPIKVHEGNHDKRMRNALAVHMPDAYGLHKAGVEFTYPALSVPGLVNLDALGVEWLGGYPDDLDYVNNDLIFQHGELARTAGDTAKAVAARAHQWVVYGHTHRVMMSSRTVHSEHGDRVIVATSMGCVCRTDGIVPSKNAREQWQNACGVVDYEVGGAGHNVCPVFIDQGRLLWDGQLVSA